MKPNSREINNPIKYEPPLFRKECSSCNILDLIKTDCCSSKYCPKGYTQDKS